MRSLDHDVRERLLQQTMQSVAGELNSPTKTPTEAVPGDATRREAMRMFPPERMRAARDLLRMKPAS